MTAILIAIDRFTQFSLNTKIIEIRGSGGYHKGEARKVRVGWEWTVSRGGRAKNERAASDNMFVW